MQATRTYRQEPASPDLEPREVTLTCPSFPNTLQKAMDLILHPDRMEVSSVARMVDEDWEIRDRMLQVINSSYYGLNRAVDTPNRMVVLLGPVTVSGMLVGMDLLKLRDTFDEQTEPVFIRLMQHSAATAFLARHIAELIRTSDGGADKLAHQHVGESFATGMIHDFGRIILLFNRPSDAGELYGALCGEQGISVELIREKETEFFGCDPVDVGVDFSRTLRFPDVATDVIRYHLSPDEIRQDPLSVEARMVRAVAAAHTAANSMGYAFPCPRSEEDCIADKSWAALVEHDLPGFHASELARRIIDLRAFVSEYVSLLVS
ncbi:MAG: HDOD domain-containing protein [Bacteroidetes bacterium]|nr:HDOD domain-containing protein [Bacteroidota bacterium]